MKARAFFVFSLIALLAFPPYVFAQRLVDGQYIPYSGATQDLNLGTFAVTTTGAVSGGTVDATTTSTAAQFVADGTDVDYTFSGDTDTGIESNGANSFRAKAGGQVVATFSNTGGIPQASFASSVGTATYPNITLGPDKTEGFYKTASIPLNIGIAGAFKMGFSSTRAIGIGANGFSLQFENSSPTNPVFVPDLSDQTSGLGGAAGHPSIITSSVESIGCVVGSCTTFVSAGPYGSQYFRNDGSPITMPVTTAFANIIDANFGGTGALTNSLTLYTALSNVTGITATYGGVYTVHCQVSVDAASAGLLHLSLGVNGTAESTGECEADAEATAALDDITIPMTCPYSATAGDKLTCMLKGAGSYDLAIRDYKMHIKR
jgi:hypothetical protein